MAYGTITVVNAAIRIVQANTNRISLVIVNGGPETSYIGEDSSVVAGSGANAGTKIVSNGTFTEDSGGTRMYMGDVWGISATTTSTALHYWERNR